MQAAINTRYGSPEVLTIGEVERPHVSEGEVLVRVRASAVTEGDRRLRAADFPGISALFGRLVTGLRAPKHPVGGSTFAGEVVEVGAGVTRLQPGDDVFGTTMHGAYAEYLVASADSDIGRMPQGVTHAEAAAIPYGAGTAVYFLSDLAELQAGERALIVGASGGVGRMAVQLAKHLGAHVTAVCSGDQALVRQLGADVVIDYTQEDFRDRPETWDVILDTTEGDHFAGVRGKLTPVGRYLSLYVTVLLLWQMLWTKLVGGPRALTGIAMGNPKQNARVRELVEQGALEATIARRYALTEIAAAHAHVEEARPHGTVVVEAGAGSPSRSNVAAPAAAPSPLTSPLSTAPAPPASVTL